MVQTSAEGAFQAGESIEVLLVMNCAFSAGVWVPINPGALPQAQIESCAFGAKRKQGCGGMRDRYSVDKCVLAP
jgi:hypothetical protein